jgi:adenylate kinase
MFNMNRRRWVFAALSSLLTPAHAQLNPARVIILIGPPGSGKTLQAGYLSRRFKIPAVSMQRLLEQEVGRKTPIGKALAASLSSGELVTDGPANELMKSRLLRSDAGRGFILDGYPVTEVQAQALDQFLADHNFPKPIVVVIDAPDDLLRQRMTQRGRADDREHGNIDRRLAQYRDVGALVEKWYGQQNSIHVDGRGAATDVARRVALAIDTAASNKELKVRPADGLKVRTGPQK